MKLYKHFRLKKGKYIDDDGNELDTNYIVSRSHYIQEDFGFVEVEYAAPIRAEVERLKCELSNNQKADISIADLRKVFAHRASRITEELNQGANQLMTLSDFRIAVADMGWRIGFDQIGELQSKLSAANQRIAELEEQNKKYWFMIEHGLGVEDITPPTYPHP